MELGLILLAGAVVIAAFVLALTLLRLVWLALRPAAPRIDMPGWARTGARLMHAALWILLLALPVTAFLALGSEGHPLTLLGGVRVEKMPLIAESAVAPLADWGEVHETLGNALIWLAGLQSISPTLYEAAAIEGASRWQAFRYVTWPGLRNTAVLVLIVITMQAFALFAQIDVMTKGGPLDSTQTMVFQAVERGYRKQDIAAGSVISVVVFLIVLTISIVQHYLTREKK